MKAIYLLGSERSGSNLLRTLLGNHHAISAPIAPHLCLTFYNQFEHYLPLNASKRAELIDDINQFVNLSFHEWNIDLTKSGEKVEALNSFPQFLDFSYSEKARQENKNAYFCKDNEIHKFALGILKDVPQAKFIYLYRDPRDQVASWIKTPMYLHTVYDAIVKWNKEQNEVLALKKFYNLDMISIKYEELISDTPSVISKVLNYLELPIDENCFQTRKENEEAHKHPLWKNINKPIQKQNFGKYKEILSLDEINLVETLAAKNMSELDYNATSSQNWKRGNIYAFRFKQKLRRNISIRKNKQFKVKKMAILLEKSKFRKELFAKFKEKK